ncbi:MAG: hypothetical protein FWG85_07965, partial [Bacteroidetes bacterium]|nr:hypothetical protein [Bacteroidota bacterium]
NDVLYIECYCVERGDYKLEIIDLLGGSVILHEWRNTRISTLYDFEFPATNLASGPYIIIMSAPRTRHHYKFTKM